MKSNKAKSLVKPKIFTKREKSASYTYVITKKDNRKKYNKT